MEIDATFSPQDVLALAEMHILLPEDDPEQVEIELQRGLEFERRRREHQRWRAIQKASVLVALASVFIFAWTGFFHWLAER